MTTQPKAEPQSMVERDHGGFVLAECEYVNVVGNKIVTDLRPQTAVWIIGGDDAALKGEGE